MANLTKEQRQAKEKAQQESRIAELEAQLKAKDEELQQKLQAQKEEFEQQKNSDTSEIENVSAVRAKQIQKTKKIPLDTVVPVVCNTYGGATYSSKKMQGYKVEWDEYGSEEFMELAELVAMRNTDRRFFEDNWIILNNTEDYTAMELYDFLKVTKFYEKIFTPENIDSLFAMNADDIIRVLSGMSKGMKSTIASIALKKIQSNELDSTSKINAFEDALNVKFSI